MLKTDKRAVAPLDGSDKGSISLRFGILVCLCVQNASHALLARYSQVSTCFNCYINSIFICTI